MFLKIICDLKLAVNLTMLPATTHYDSFDASKRHLLKFIIYLLSILVVVLLVACLFWESKVWGSKESSSKAEAQVPLSSDIDATSGKSNVTK